jgi:hypothetical protein
MTSNADGSGWLRKDYTPWGEGLCEDCGLDGYPNRYPSEPTPGNALGEARFVGRSRMHPGKNIAVVERRAEGVVRANQQTA